MSTSQQYRKQLTLLQRKKKKNLKKNRKRMMNLYNKLNSNDLVVTYLSSHRRDDGEGLALDLLYGPDKFNIHSFMPSFQKPGPKGIESEGIRSISGFNLKRLTIPTVHPDLEEECKQYWHSLKKGQSVADHLTHQAEKHLKYNQLQGQDIYAVTLSYGKEVVSEAGRHYLMAIIQKRGYYAGQIYSCADFTKVLEEELDGVKVTFLPHPNGKHWNVLYLHEIHMLYNNDASERILGARKQSFTCQDVFLLEDLRLRRKSFLFCTPANP